MLLICYGTRPEFIKSKPIIDELIKRKLPFKTLFTGQHDMLKNIKSDYVLEILDNSNIDRLSNVTSNCVNGISTILKEDKEIKYVMVQGDTTSAAAIAWGALNNNIKIIHLEAGLRSFDKKNPFPEENNRLLISDMATIHLCPTTLNKDNLNKENIFDNIFVVGNTGLDPLLSMKNEIKYENKVLVTLHRRENHEIMNHWFEVLNMIAKNNPNLEFVLPIHPNPNVLKHKNLLTNIKVIDPIPHSDLVKFITECKLVISDSGSIQEECSFLNKKIIVCRKTTERPESIGMTSFLCEKPENLKEIFDFHIEKYIVSENICPFGDGKSSIKIVDILENIIYL